MQSGLATTDADRSRADALGWCWAISIPAKVDVSGIVDETVFCESGG